ncbi:MAG: hypothetical protein FJZ89_06430 [Chloroflexi bacterium]|nr:hypothetical protein [Chloroflexota bacterium]
MSKRDRPLAQDFSDEERDFAAELGRYFDLEGEELPPLYMQALTPPPGEEAIPPRLVEHVRTRTFAILRLPLPGQTLPRLTGEGTGGGREWLPRLFRPPRLAPRLALAFSLLVILVAVGALLAVNSPPTYSDELPQVVTMEPAAPSSQSPSNTVVLHLDRPLSPNVAYALTISPTLAVRLFQQERALLIVPEQHSWGEADYRIQLLAVNGRGEAKEYHFSFAARKP